MQITRETDYAISCILYMAKEPERTYVISEIAKPQLIPESFLAKILQKLVKAGVVKSMRGIKGGFLLARKPEDINLFDIVETIEGAPSINVCVVNRNRCIMCGSCPAYTVWMEVRSDVEKRLKHYTFERLLSGTPEAVNNSTCDISMIPLNSSICDGKSN